MKYKAQQLNNGNYAVVAGSKYFTDTETDSKEQAEKMAIIKSMQWYQSQIDTAWQNGLDSGLFDYYEDRGDYLC